MRHWFSVYGHPGVRTPTCQRTGCDAVNPRTLTAAELATYEDVVTAISRARRRADQRGDVFETAGGNRRIVNPDWPRGDEPFCEPADGEPATCITPTGFGL
ncbi:MAG: hypothetical protein LC798_11885 [Chloroflexi bacterium]|nr:hypothetical protein [Chloroflexota bacterium]